MTQGSNDERVQRYADAFWEPTGDRDRVEAVIAVADAEQAELRAKVARVEALAEDWAAHCDGTPLANVMGKQSVTVDTATRLLRAALEGPTS